MRVSLLTIEQLRDACLRWPQTLMEIEEEALPGCTAPDPFLAIESIKKDNRNNVNLRTRTSAENLSKIIMKQGILMAGLDNTSLQEGLFVRDEGLVTEFWDEAVEPTVDPANSMRLIAAKAYDVMCDAGMLDEVREVFGI